ncbi:hypothetical protein LWI28_011429 [Acer negundo]|uniref:PGG domain-containing protein n=1 Tax=Acer negundo TaxID=4023 RepID=A0AAD5IDL7_ACENE|nr:hypothetical protein LWI28_011429 [Acer negundo]KAK4839804.1 hypothetical protein QYF36_025116 [Acer negundo]
MTSIALTGKMELAEEKNTGDTMSCNNEFYEALLSKFLETEKWTVNPLHHACEHGNLHIAMEMGKRKLQLATIPNEDGNIAMHIVSAIGDVKMVEFLEELHPGSCLVENKSSMIPLQIAVVKGHSVVIKKLISLCPESLEKLTSKQETVFHLALKNSQSDAFQVLVEEAKKLNQGHLLEKKDDEGNTVLQIATFKRLTQIVELLTFESSSSSSLQIEMQVISEPDTDSQEINLIHQNRDLNRHPVETKHVLLVVLVMIAAATFTVTCNLPDVLVKEIYPSVHATTTSDVISGRLPTVVYLMVFNTAGFFTSMLVISYLIWPLALRSILLFVVVCTCIVYIIIVDKITPMFWVRVGNFSFSSISLVWTSAVAFIAVGVTIIRMGKYALQCFRRFVLPDY